MTLSRRSFLGGTLAGFVTALLPLGGELERPLRRIWQVPANAPVGGRGAYWEAFDKKIEALAEAERFYRSVRLGTLRPGWEEGYTHLYRVTCLPRYSSLAYNPSWDLEP